MTPLIPPKTAAFVALALASAVVMAGCSNIACSPVEVPTQVTLALATEEARTLPILVSGETQVAGQEIPDAHGRIATTLSIAHAGESNTSLRFTEIDIASLRLAIRAGERDVPVEVLKVEGGSSWTRRGVNEFDGHAVNGSEIVLWWAVDRDRTQTPLEIVLPEGAPYTATVSFDWEYSSCIAHASGHLSQPFQDFVEASVNAKTFQSAGAPRVEPEATGVGLVANFTIVSGLDVEVSAVSARAVFLGNGTQVDASATGGAAGNVGGTLGVNAQTNASVQATLPSAGLVLFPTLKWSVDGAAASDVTPRDTLSVYSGQPTGAAYAKSGTMLPAALPPGGGLYIVLVDITYTPSDPTLGVTTDAFAFAVVV